MFLLWLRQLPLCGDWIPASAPPPTKGRSSPTNTPDFPPSSFIPPSFAWVYIFFSTGQVLLSAFSWCSACTSVSEGVFLMYHGERCTTPPLPTSPPICSPHRVLFSVLATKIFQQPWLGFVAFITFLFLGSRLCRLSYGTFRNAHKGSPSMRLSISAEFNMRSCNDPLLCDLNAAL